jgi:glutathione synthase
MHVGGRPEPIDLTERDRKLRQRLRPLLPRGQIFLFGIDVLVTTSLKSNVTSPDGHSELERTTSTSPQNLGGD